MDGTLIIYPTARKVEDQLMRAARGGCVMGYRLTTLPQLIDRLWRESADARIALDGFGERIVFGEAVVREQQGGRIGVITGGMQTRLLALVRQIKSAGLAAEDWRAADATLDAFTRTRLRDFTILFDAYERELRERGAADRHDRETGALRVLKRAELAGDRPHGLRGVEQLKVAEIYDLSLVQFMLIAALIRLIGDAEITIQAETHRVSASRFAELTWNRFVEEESIADLVLPEFVRRGGRTGRLGFLLEHLFSEAAPPPPPPADETVTLIECANPRAEAEEVARRARQAIEEDALPAERIAVIARDLAPYREALTGAFGRAQIPIVLGVGRPLRAETPARAVMALMRIPAENYARQALISLCGDSLLRFTARGYVRLLHESGYIDRRTRPLARCLESRLKEMRAALAQETDPERTERLARRVGAFERGDAAWRELLGVIEALEAPAPLSEQAERLSATLRKLRFDPAGETIDDAAAAAGAAISRALEGLAIAGGRLMPERKLTPAEFAEILDQALSETQLAAEAGERGGVRALPVLEARGLDFDRVFVVGLNDGSFPRREREDPLVAAASLPALNRALRAQLKEKMGAFMPDAPGPILRSRAQRDSEEPFLFFLALSMPAQAVVLSRSVEDGEGQAATPSAFVQEVQRILQLDAERSRPRTPPRYVDRRERLNRPAAAGRLTASAAATGIAPARAEELARRIEIERRRGEYLRLPYRQELLGEYQQDPDNRNQWPRAGWLASAGAKRAAAGPYDGRVSSSARLREFLLGPAGGALRYWSAAQLSDLAACGFKYFAHRLLRLDEQATADNELDARERGTLIHDVLRAYFAGRPDLSDRERALAALAETIKERRAIYQGEARDPVFFALEWRTLEASLREIVEFEVARRAEGAAAGEIYPEYALDFTIDDEFCGAPGRIGMRGAIDRLELFRDGRGRIERLRVVDYKNSRGLERFEKLLRPANFATSDLQTGIYALGALEQQRAELAAEPLIEASYMALRNRAKETAPLVIPREQIERTRGADDEPYSVRERIRDLIEEAGGGRFDIDPLECSDYCPYRRVCRFEKPKG